AAVAQLLEQHPALPLRITFLVEGEEEMGSPSFLPFLQRYQQTLQDVDFVFLSDTGIPHEQQMVITAGLRGLVTLEVEAIGPTSDLHSGLHGGVLLNPIQALVDLCASLHTPDGRVNIPGFYDDVLEVEPWERAELAKLGGREEDYLKFLGIDAFHTPPGVTPFEAVRFYPTLEFNGIGGGYQGEGGKTVIPSRAFVKISCRLVANQSPEKMKVLLEQTIAARAPRGVQLRIIAGHTGRPYVVVPPGRTNTPPDQSPVLARMFRATDAAVAEVWGKAPLYLREGGSVPIIGEIKRVLGLDSVMMGLFLPQDNLHAPNESFDLEIMKKGIETSRRILLAIAQP
ncbi:MAG: M20/M25/M40 family metallo-hydrolase, partial [Opitutales bacterium]|nr:M20/M25/M40 family metallo-hydrolase [Opitutales bacterium]